jgi:hypothetical protein
MMDYYSYKCAPGKEVRIKDVLNSLSESDRSRVSEEELNRVVEEVVSAAPEYSYTGYYVFGKEENVLMVQRIICR